VTGMHQNTILDPFGRPERCSGSVFDLANWGYISWQSALTFHYQWAVALMSFCHSVIIYLMMLLCATNAMLLLASHTTHQLEIFSCEHVSYGTFNN
jgi:hypothetical protein